LPPGDVYSLPVGSGAGDECPGGWVGGFVGCLLGATGCGVACAGAATAHCSGGTVALCGWLCGCVGVGGWVATFGGCVGGLCGSGGGAPISVFTFSCASGRPGFAAAPCCALASGRPARKLGLMPATVWSTGAIDGGCGAVAVGFVFVGAASASAVAFGLLTVGLPRERGAPRGEAGGASYDRPSSAAYF
jgi:hypothetical protein